MYIQFRTMRKEVIYSSDCKPVISSELEITVANSRGNAGGKVDRNNTKKENRKRKKSGNNTRYL